MKPCTMFYIPLVILAFACSLAYLAMFAWFQCVYNPHLVCLITVVCIRSPTQLLCHTHRFHCLYNFLVCSGHRGILCSRQNLRLLLLSWLCSHSMSSSLNRSLALQCFMLLMSTPGMPHAMDGQNNVQQIEVVN